MKVIIIGFNKLFDVACVCTMDEEMFSNPESSTLQPNVQDAAILSIGSFAEQEFVFVNADFSMGDYAHVVTKVTPNFLEREGSVVHLKLRARGCLISKHNSMYAT